VGTGQWLNFPPKRQRTCPPPEGPSFLSASFVSCYLISKSHQIKAPLGCLCFTFPTWSSLHLSPGIWFSPAASLPHCPVNHNGHCTSSRHAESADHILCTRTCQHA
jgi:hypothetical protein